jgi:iron-sulfur cluster assembly protein
MARQRLLDLYRQQKHDATQRYLKVAVRTKGCSGNAYTMDWVNNRDRLDEEVKVDEQLSLLIDAKALFTLLGSQMDYTDDKLSQGFVFMNPNVKETCGCGLSFIV